MGDILSQSLHARIRDQFHRRILAGDLEPGDRLPPESQIMDQFNVSRGTVNRALRDLEQQGVLQRRRGAGTFVRQVGAQKHSTHRHVAMFTPWAAQGEPIGFVQSHIHHALSSVCSQHDLLFSLQCLSSEGSTLRERMLGAAKALLAREIKIILFCPNELPHEQMHWNREVVDLLVQGGANVVLIDRDVASHPERSEFTWVSYDNHRGGAMLVRHLYEQGYRRIAFVGTPRESTAVSQRLSGYMDGLHACGLPIDQGLLFAPDSAADVDGAFCERMMTEARPDAVICKDIDLTLLVSQGLGRRGLRVGPDVGVAGFDDAPIASLLPVPLTVIRQPVEPFVAAVHRVLQSYVSGDQQPFKGEQIVIRTELVARASTSRHPG